MTGEELYISLLKKVLTNTLHAAEPSQDETPSAFVLQFLDHYVRGPAISMLPMVRLDNIERCVRDVVERGIPGDLIETGVWRGGDTILMRALLAAYDDGRDRNVWVADSFEGLPEPDAARFPLEAQAHAGVVMTTAFRHFAASLDDVRANFAAFDLLDDRVRFLPGWFKDTLPTAPIDRLAVLRLDGDYYESTRDALTSLYDRVSVGGYVIVDDYGEDDWTYCRRAVDEFRVERAISAPLITVDARCSYWQRSR